MKEPNIFSYLDYRSYLQDLYGWKKENVSRFSYGYLAQRAEMDKSSLLKIFKGERHLPLDKVATLGKVLKLRGSTYAYFENMVFYGRSQNDSERESYLEQMSALRPLSQKKIEKAQYDFFNTWYISVLWSLMGIIDCNAYTDLSKFVHPNITKEQANEAIETLINLNLIYLDTDGYYRKSAQNITLGNNWKTPKVDEYLRSSISMASQAVEDFSKDQRDISSLIVDIPSENLPIIKEKITRFRKELIRTINEFGPSDQVYQISMQIFPLTNKVSS